MMINELSINFANRANEGFAEKRCDVLVVAYILSTIHILKGSLSIQGGGVADIVDNDVKFFLFFLTRYICITLR